MSRGRVALVSVVVPTFNESRVISDCVVSLLKQDFENQELILVDDGSTDKTVEAIRKIQQQFRNARIRLFTQKHRGPGEARNLGAARANGRILVFLDADMTFERGFIRKLVRPIVQGVAVGTNSSEELLANPDNYWAKCWNIGRYAAANIINKNPLKYVAPKRSDYGGVFRSILRVEFIKVGGFEGGGDYTDDVSLSKRLNKKAALARGAIYFHKNPDTLIDVWQRARWIGSGNFFTGGCLRKFTSLVKFSLPVSLAKGLVIGLRYNYLPFVCFKIVYDSAIWTSVFGSLLGRRRGRLGDLTDERDERDERDEKDGEDERE